MIKNTVSWLAFLALLFLTSCSATGGLGRTTDIFEGDTWYHEAKAYVVRDADGVCVEKRLELLRAKKLLPKHIPERLTAWDFDCDGRWYFRARGGVLIGPIESQDLDFYFEQIVPVEETAKHRV